MDTQLLRTLLVLARTGNFTAAAEESHQAQSTVTSQIQALERELGARLFDRLPRGARLTDVGQRAVALAREVLAAEQRLLGVGRAEHAVEAEVRVGAPESVCAYRLAPLLADVSLRWPGITVHLSPVGTRAALARVREGSLDLALVLEDEPPTTRLEVAALAVEPIELVAAPGHAADGRYFLLEEGCSYTDRFVREHKPRHVTRFGSIEAVRSCAVAGLGESVLPRMAVAEHLEAGSLRRVRKLPGSTLFLLTDPRRSPSAAVRTVLQKLT